MAMKMETGERNLSSTWWKTSPAPSGRHEVPLKRQRCLCHVVNSRVQPSVGVRLPISFHLKNLGGMKLRARRSTACKKGKSYPKWSLAASGSLRESIAHARTMQESAIADKIPRYIHCFVGGSCSYLRACDVDVRRAPPLYEMQRSRSS